MTTNDNRKRIEIKFHDVMFSGSNNLRKRQRIFYVKSIQKTELEYVYNMFGDMKGKKILIYGIGQHISLIREFVNKGGYVVAIDISSEAVEKYRDRIAEDNCQNKYVVLEMDCENIAFKPCSFDFVFGRAIIHHLEMQKSLNQINFILKKEGKFAFIEPLGTNPVIQLYRHLTPKDRTPDEHPLTCSDLSYFSKNFRNVDFKFLYALTPLSFLIRLLTHNDRYFIKSFHFFQKIDELLLKIPRYKLLCWDAIITGEKLEN